MMEFKSGDFKITEEEMEGFINCMELTMDMNGSLTEDQYKVYEQCTSYQYFLAISRIAAVETKFVMDNQKGCGICFISKNGYNPVIWFKDVRDLNVQGIAMLGLDALLKGPGIVLPEGKDDFCSKIYFRVVSSEKECEIYIPFYDMKLEYRLFVGKKGDKIMSTQLTHSLLKKNDIEISKAELYRLALNNTPKLFPAKCLNIESILTGSKAEVASKNPFDACPMIVATNDMSCMGAGVIFYKDWLRDTFNQDLYILPSSIHKCIILKRSDEYHLFDLKNMVRSVNKAEVSDEDFLSNNVFVYNNENKTITEA